MKRLFAFLAVLWALTALGAPADALTPGQRAVILGGGGPCYGTTLALNFSSQGGGGCYLGHNSSNFALVPGWTFTRASTGLSTRGDGTIASYGSSVPRITAPSSVTNLLTGSATLGTQSVTVGAGPLLLSFQGTGSVTLSGAATGTLAGTGATNRVSLPVVATAGSLTLTVSGSVTSAQLDPTEGVPLTTPRTYVPTTSTALTVDDWTAVRGNFVPQSNTLTVAPWGASASTIASTGVVSPPSGRATAFLLTETVANSTHFLASSALTATAGQQIAISVDAQAQTRSYVGVYEGVLGKGKFFNLATGAVAGNLVAAPDNATITPLGGGWYRCTIFVTPTTATVALSAYLTSDGTTISYVGTVGVGVYLSAIQAEPVLYTPDVLTYPTAYIPTTSAPVYVYDQQLPGRGILIEQAATNLLQQSNVPTNAAWTLLNASGSANATIAPDGSNTGSSIIDNATSARHINFQLDSVSVVGPYTYCAYAKAGTLGFAQVMLSTVDLKTYAATFNLSTGAETAIESVGSPTGTSYSSAAAAFGYFRLCVTENADATTGIYGITALSNSGTPTYDANGNPTYVGTGQNIYTYQADLIANAFPLSPIPTTSAAVTRAADVVGIPYSGFSVPHTGVVKYLRYAGQTSVVGRLVGLQSAAGVMSVYDDGATSDIFDKAGTGTIASTTGATLGLTRHVAWSVTPSLATISGGGGAPSSGAVSGLVAPTQGTLGSSAVGAQFLNGFIQSLTLYNTAKAAAKLQQLSQ